MAIRQAIGKDSVCRHLLFGFSFAIIILEKCDFGVQKRRKNVILEPKNIGKM